MGPKQKKRKHNKDPLRPKRYMSAYLYYAKDCREQLAAEGLKLKVSECSKEIARRWAEHADKSKYEQLSARDKARFEAEMAVYNKNKGVKKPRAATAYFHFLKEFRKRPFDGKRSIAETSSQAGQEWREMSDEQKQPYIDMYHAQRAQIAEDEAKKLAEGANGAAAEDEGDEESEEEEEEEEDDE